MSDARSPVSGEPPTGTVPDSTAVDRVNGSRLAAGGGLSALLGLVAVVVVQPAWLPAGAFGAVVGAPWWVPLAVLAGGVLFAVALVCGSRRAAWGSVLVLGGVGAGAVVLAVADSGADGRWTGAFVCLAGGALVAALSVRRSAWQVTRAALARSRGDLARRWRPVTAVAVVGTLLGGLLGATASAGGERLHRALQEEPEESANTVDATSEPSSDRRGVDDTGRWVFAEGIKADTVTWQDTVDGPVELAQCTPAAKDHDGVALVDEWYTTATTLDGYRSAAEAARTEDDGTAEDQSVLGVDPATGEELWRYTVHGDQPYRLGQVAVDAECGVLVLIDPGVVVALSSVTGEVTGVSQLPSPLSEWHEERGAAEAASGGELRAELAAATGEGVLWRFVPTAREEAETSAMVRLPAADRAVLASSTRLMTVRRADAEVLSFDERRRSVRCRYLADYVNGEPVVLRYGCDRPTLYWLGTGWLIPPAGEEAGGLDGDGWEEGTSVDGALGAVGMPVPDLGCWDVEDTSWSDVEFSWMQADGSSVRLNGGCVWDAIDPAGQGTDRAQDTGDRLVHVERDTDGPGSTWAESLPDELAGAPTLQAHHRDHEVTFHVSDGAVHPYPSDQGPWGPWTSAAAFRDPEGEDLVAVAQAGGPEHTGSPIVALTDEGSVVFHRYFHRDATENETEQEGADTDDDERMPKVEDDAHVGSTDAARAACDGTRDIRADAATETVLVLCTTALAEGEYETEVTALTGAEEGPAGG